MQINSSSPSTRNDAMQQIDQEGILHQANLITIIDSPDPQWAIDLIGENERHYTALLKLVRQCRRSKPS